MTYEYREMSATEIDDFLSAPRYAVVGTNRRGPPQLTPVWYLWDEGTFYMSIFVDSAKYRNLARDPRLGLCISGDNPDARAVMIYGFARIITGSNARTEDIRWRLVRRYFDDDAEARRWLAELPDGARSALVAVTPERVVSHDFN